MLHDNPAERLRNILESGRAIKSEVQCRKAWAQLFFIDPTNGDELFSKLGKLMALPRETLVLLKANFPRQVAPAEQWRAQVDAAFNNQQLGGQWVSFIGHIDNSTINLLTVTADLIESRLSAKLLPDVDLDKIQQGLRELIEDIDRANLSWNLKSYLAREISELLQHTRDYRITGAVPILKQAESMVGHVIVDPEYKSFLTSHELGKRLLDNLNAAAAVLTVALQLPQLGPAFAQLLK